MFNSKWPTWVYASVVNHFKDVADTNNIFFFVEGDDRATATKNEYVELRLNGPTFIEEASNCFVIEVGINLLITVKKGNTNAYRPHIIAGLFIQQMIDIPIYDKGFTAPVGGYTVQFCLPLSDRDKRVKWNYFGQVDADIAVLQGAITATYKVKM